MKRAFLLLFAFGACVAFYSCKKTEQTVYTFEEITQFSSKEDAMKEFSIAFSRLVAKNESVRQFLKKESLRRVDNDTDVFYPFVKEDLVDGQYTFRELLIKEIGNELTLCGIERILPTLTIYVSDVTWLDPDGFCAETWDTSCEDVAVTYVESNGICRKLYHQGLYMGDLEVGTIPGGPVLIIKECERIKASVGTKSGVMTYSFISDAFDPSKSNMATKGDIRHTGEYSTSWIKGQDPEDASNIISAANLNKLNPDIIKSYEMFANDSYALPNDYIYYGMTPESPEGRLRNDVRSKIVRFKIHPTSFDTLFDDKDPDKGDRIYGNYFETDDNGGKRQEPSIETIYSKLWADGALEIRVVIFANYDSGKSFVEYSYHVLASDLFTLKEKAIKKEQWGSTIFKWYITWRYTMEKRNSDTLASKWYYPENTPDLPIWDLCQNSAYRIVVSEVDCGAKIKEEYLTTYKKADTLTPKLSLNIKDIFKVDFGWDHSDETVTEKKVTVEKQEEDDLMFDGDVLYKDKYISGKLSNTHYVVESYGGDAFTFTILPYRY